MFTNRPQKWRFVIGYPNLTYLLIGQNFVNIMITELSERRIDLHHIALQGGNEVMRDLSNSFIYVYTYIHIAIIQCGFIEPFNKSHQQNLILLM